MNHICRVATAMAALYVHSIAISQVAGNRGFEIPAFAPGGWNYAITGPGVDWTFNSKAGIANGSSPWGTVAHKGAQYAFIQSDGSGIGQISQTIGGFTVGKTYQLRFWMSNRPGYGGNAVRVILDGTTEIMPYAAALFTDWQRYGTAPFTATSTSHTFLFEGQAAPFSDRTNILDDVKIVELASTAPKRFRNGDFENPVIPTGQFTYDPRTLNAIWQYSPISWNIGSGIANSDSSWGTSAASGSQYAFIQGSASVTQTFRRLTPGVTYKVVFAMALRHGSMGSFPGNPLQLVLDDTNTIFAATSPSSNDWVDYESATFVATSGTHKLSFIGGDSSVDRATLLDNVRLVEVPIPLAASIVRE